MLLKLSSNVKFSQNLKVAKVIGNGTTSLVCMPLLASHISFGVGYCLYPLQRQCEKPDIWIRTVGSRTLFLFIKAELGDGEARLNYEKK